MFFKHDHYYSTQVPGRQKRKKEKKEKKRHGKKVERQTTEKIEWDWV